MNSLTRRAIGAGNGEIENNGTKPDDNKVIELKLAISFCCNQGARCLQKADAEKATKDINDILQQVQIKYNLISTKTIPNCPNVALEDNANVDRLRTSQREGGSDTTNLIIISRRDGPTLAGLCYIPKKPDGSPNTPAKIPNEKEQISNAIDNLGAIDGCAVHEPSFLRDGSPVPAHELGHSLGLDHLTELDPNQRGCSNLMAPSHDGSVRKFCLTRAQRVIMRKTALVRANKTASGDDGASKNKLPTNLSENPVTPEDTAGGNGIGNELGNGKGNGPENGIGNELGNGIGNEPGNGGGPPSFGGGSRTLGGGDLGFGGGGSGLGGENGTPGKGLGSFGGNHGGHQPTRSGGGTTRENFIPTDQNNENLILTDRGPGSRRIKPNGSPFKNGQPRGQGLPTPSFITRTSKPTSTPLNAGGPPPRKSTHKSSNTNNIPGSPPPPPSSFGTGRVQTSKEVKNQHPGIQGPSSGPIGNGKTTAGNLGSSSSGDHGFDRTLLSSADTKPRPNISPLGGSQVSSKAGSLSTGGGRNLGPSGQHEQQPA
ncbi:hypothetical protein CDD80_4544 [Ophiocordyceps camponoti-rufipedis]|uniref:Uncharacterized protein n=1 Tax=Ophiocordyceps camponoti-rufipedis TaxID=2004952 RepID=A0A2C5YZU6_9HYPO|nr:hypothetical protein CDD80_4544 [Ophiocordyceps camponoti-rufipedis]